MVAKTVTFSLVLWLFCSVSALAQGLNPGAVLQGFNNPLNKKPVTQQPADGQQGVEKKDDAAISDRQAARDYLPPDFAQSVVIKEVNVTGNTKVKDKSLKKITAPYEGKQTTFTELQTDVVNKITDTYKKKGYVTSYAQLPPQTIKEGKLEVAVQEGKVTKLVFQEDAWFKDRAIKPRMLTDVGNVFQLNDLVKDIRRLNENPELTLAATLEDGEQPGETIVILRNLEESSFPLHIGPYVDNLGRKEIGQLRAGVNVTHNNLLGFGDELFTTHAWSRDSYSNFHGYEIPVGEHGTALGVNQGFSVFDFEADGARFEGNSNVVNTYIRQELFRNATVVADTELGFAVKNSKLDFNGFPNSEDKLRVITQAFNVEENDNYGRTFVRSEIAGGVDMFGATIGSFEEFNREAVPSRFGAGSQFTRYTISASRAQRLLGPTYGIFRAIGQVSPDPLTSIEQFQIGGAQTVRGYREGRFIGDNGFVVSAEVHAPLRFLPDSWALPQFNYRLKDNLELVGFVEGGGVFDNNVGVAGSPGVNAQAGFVDANAWALGAGVGLRANLNEYFSLRLDVGFPLFNAFPDTQAARVHFGLESRVF